MPPPNDKCQLANRHLSTSTTEYDICCTTCVSRWPSFRGASGFLGDPFTGPGLPYPVVPHSVLAGTGGYAVLHHEK